MKRKKKHKEDKYKEYRVVSIVTEDAPTARMVGAIVKDLNGVVVARDDSLHYWFEILEKAGLVRKESN